MTWRAVGVAIILVGAALAASVLPQSSVAAEANGFRCDVRVSRFTRGPVEIGGKRIRFYYSHWFQLAYGRPLSGAAFNFPAEMSFLHGKKAANLSQADALCKDTAMRLKALTHARGMKATVKPMVIE